MTTPLATIIFTVHPVPVPPEVAIAVYVPSVGVVEGVRVPIVKTQFSLSPVTPAMVTLDVVEYIPCK